jgi:hypothetical protein
LIQPQNASEIQSIQQLSNLKKSNILFLYVTQYLLPGFQSLPWLQYWPIPSLAEDDPTINLSMRATISSSHSAAIDSSDGFAPNRSCDWADKLLHGLSQCKLKCQGPSFSSSSIIGKIFSKLFFRRGIRIKMKKPRDQFWTTIVCTRMPSQILSLHKHSEVEDTFL